MPNRPVQPLAPEVLRRCCDLSLLNFTSTAELESVDELIGQKRAIDAIGFGARIGHAGFNIFALGPSRSGRHYAIRRLLERKAAEEPVPDDWVYVNNFAAPERPKALKLPSGIAAKFKDSMAELVDDLSSAIPAIFESEDYRNRRKAIDESFEAVQEAAFDELRSKAEAQDVAILRTPIGFALAPVSGGQVVKPDVFNALPEAERAAIAKKIELLQKDLEQVLRSVPQHEKERRDKIRKLNTELAELIVGLSINEVAGRFRDLPAIQSHLSDVRADIIANTELFLRPQDEESQPFGNAPVNNQKHPKFARYRVNVLVSNEGNGSRGAPVIDEGHPTLANIVGRIEHQSLMGALVTDFTMIRAGALHRANGGYLVLDALRVLIQPFSWDALKRCLRNKEVKFTSTADELSLVSTIALAPDPIPLQCKVVLVGDRLLYYLLASLDPDFADLFKVQADFEDVTERSPETVQLFAGLIGTIAKREGLRPFAPAAVARLVEESARDAEDAERLSLRVGVIADVLREANFWCTENAHSVVALEDVDRALAERRRRAERLRERSLEAITRDIVRIDTDGEAVGQVNGLSVVGIGGLSFGKPSRITARVRMGSGKVVDIEREVELGGPIHSKGVLILSSFLATRYALNTPMSLWASLVFEQSYGGVEGDSASSAELYALLSALSDVPIKQSFAVTGSVDQFGRVQAIGGVNEKIEGFFDVCKARGLTGKQGVLVPADNVKHLMLRPDVVDAVHEKKFAVYAVSEIDEGIQLLTGIEAGARGADGKFPEGSINARVESCLARFAEARRAFGREGSNGGDEEKRR